jgi:hypothetical protein
MNVLQDTRLCVISVYEAVRSTEGAFWFDEGMAMFSDSR